MQESPMTVSALNQTVREILEANFPVIWVEGEISNWHQAASGHAYFSLKDADTQVRCALFKGQRLKTACILKNGLHIQVRATVTLYEGRGDYQLLVHEVMEGGLGALQKAFEALKQRLSAEGLFELSRKRPIPSCAMNIGVITSPHGAAIQDIISTLKRRHPLATIWIYPTLVQGPQSAVPLLKAIQQAKTHGICELLIVARGGGSLEDLWGFNDEAVVRALAAFPVPVISGVGHETDVTLCDWVADLRAPTPTAAAECASIDTQAWLSQIQKYEQLLTLRITRYLQGRAQQLDYLSRQLRHPKERIENQKNQLGYVYHQLCQKMEQQLQHQQARLQNAVSKLDILSPLTTLSRGYSMVTQNHQIIRRISQIKPELPLSIQFAEGHIEAYVVKNKR